MTSMPALNAVLDVLLFVKWQRQLLGGGVQGDALS